MTEKPWGGEGRKESRRDELGVLLRLWKRLVTVEEGLRASLARAIAGLCHPMASGAFMGMSRKAQVGV